MGMFVYYLLHTSRNQLKKFVRTWAFPVACMLAVVGWLVYRWAGWYYHRLVLDNTLLPEDVSELFLVGGLSWLDLTELAVGLGVLGILAVQAVGAEKSVSRLFLQADVNLLFASDRTPQEVLAHKVATSLGLPMVATVLLLVQLPHLMRTLGLSLVAALSIPVAWCLLLAYSAAIKMLLFELGSRHPWFHLGLRVVVFGGLALLGFVLYQSYGHSEERLLLVSAADLLNAPPTRLVPVWGWIKGVPPYALEGNMPLLWGTLAVSVGGLAGLVWLVLRIPVDYYEPAANFTRQMQMLRDAVVDRNATLLVLMPRRARHVTTRDGFAFGHGSSVYFYKVLYNRVRFSRFGWLTGTMVTYALAALAAGLYVRLFMDEPIAYIPVLVLAVMVFFRTVISPVTEDVRMAPFLMQPSSIWAKLFFSLLGGSANCALDVAVPLMVGYAAAGFSPFAGLAYVPVLASVDFFASASGVFADISLPSAIDVNIKQVIQVLLLYVGILFDGSVLTYGIATSHVAAGFVLVAVLDVVFGATFLGLAGAWLHPHAGARPRTDGYVPDETGARRAYTRVGLAAAAMFAAIHVGQHLLAAVVPGHPLVALYLPIYGFGLPAFVLVAGRWLPRGALEARRLGWRRWLMMVPACLFAGYAGNVLGLAVAGLVRTLVPVSLGWRVPLYVTGVGGDATGATFAVQAVLLAVASPLVEEFVFRRCVIDRLAPFGEGPALVSSALLFALFHDAVNQACYAFVLGLVLGYVYLRTGRLHYTVGLHVLINALGSVVLPALLLWASQSLPGGAANDVQLVAVLGDPGVAALVAYVALLFVASLLGMVVLVYGVRERDVCPDGIALRTAFSSWGFAAFVVVAGTLLVLG